MSTSMDELMAAHRMADPVVRRRAAATAALLFGVAWMLVSLVGNPNGVFSQDELRHLGGVPFAPPQIQRRIPPAIPGQDLDQLITELENRMSGRTPSPSPSATQTR